MPVTVIPFTPTPVITESAARAEYLGNKEYFTNNLLASEVFGSKPLEGCRVKFTEAGFLAAASSLLTQLASDIEEIVTRRQLNKAYADSKASNQLAKGFEIEKLSSFNLARATLKREDIYGNPITDGMRMPNGERCLRHVHGFPAMWMLSAPGALEYRSFWKTVELPNVTESLDEIMDTMTCGVWRVIGFYDTKTSAYIVEAVNVNTELGNAKFSRQITV